MVAGHKFSSFRVGICERDIERTQKGARRTEASRRNENGVGICKRGTVRSQKRARRISRIRKGASRRKQNGVRAIADSKAHLLVLPDEISDLPLLPDEDADCPVLPEEILNLAVLLLEDIADVARFSMISKQWYKTIHSNSFWNMQPACAHPILCCLHHKNANLTWADLPTSSDVKSKVNCSWRHLRKLDVNFKKIVQTAFSHGLLYIGMVSGELWVLNPFKASVPKDVLVPPKDVIGGRIVDSTFHSDLSINSYTVILTVGPMKTSLGQYHLAMYQSSTRKWSRSKSVEGEFFYQSQTCIGNSVYLVHGCGNCVIYKYNSFEDSWSRKPFCTGGKKFGNFMLTQSKGKLLLVGQAWGQLYVWIANEMKEAYALTLLFSARDKASGVVESFQPLDDLLLVTDEHGFTIYHASTNSFQLLSNCPDGVQSCFISESSSLFLAGKLGG